MSSANLQRLILERLQADAGVTALVGTRVYTRPPTAPTFPYVTFGPAEKRRTGDGCVKGWTEYLQIDVWSRYVGGETEAKNINDAIEEALHLYVGDASPLLEGLHEIRVALTRVIDDPDGITSHGIVQIEADYDAVAA